MITTTQKDAVLDCIIANERDAYISFDLARLAPQFGISSQYCLLILEDMQNRGFMELNRMAGYNVFCNLKMPIYDFYRNGGYEFEEHIIEGEILKLKEEIQALSANVGKPQYDKLMTAISTIMTVYSTISKK